MWSGNNELGIEVPYQPDGNGFQTILKMGEWGPPAVWTISLGIAYDPLLVPASGDGQFAVDALIRYGSGGVTQEIDVDWCEGVLIAMPMNAVNVIARYSDFAGGAKNNTPPDLRLRVNLALGGDSSNFVTKSSKLAVPTGGSSFQRSAPVPKFARRMHVQRGGASSVGGAFAANMNYEFQGNNSSGPVGGFSGSEYLSSFAGNGIPIPASARVVRVTNTTGVDETVLLIFQLAG